MMKNQIFKNMIKWFHTYFSLFIWDEDCNSSHYVDISYLMGKFEEKQSLEYNYNQEDERGHGDRFTYINRELIFSNKYERAIESLRESKNCTRKILESARCILEHHHGDKYEDLYFIDSVTNKVLARTDYKIKEQEVLPTKAMKEMALGNPNIISVHNHPKNGLPSMSDFYSCCKIGYKYGLIVCHNGSIYKYKVHQNYNDINAEIAIKLFHLDELELSGLAYDMNVFVEKHQQNIYNLIKRLQDCNIEFKEVLWYGKN